jgi:hypothetical protein
LDGREGRGRRGRDGAINGRTIMKRVAALLCLLMKPAGAAGQELTLLEQEEILKSGFSGCLQTQIKHPDNVGASRSLLEQYCRCVAHGTVVRTTRAGFDALKQNKTNPAMIANAHHIGQECRAQLVR